MLPGSPCLLSVPIQLPDVSLALKIKHSQTHLDGQRTSYDSSTTHLSVKTTDRGLFASRRLDLQSARYEEGKL